MATIIQPRSFQHVACEIRTDDLTRQLYATDASLYEIRPEAVAFPRTAQEAAAAIQAADDAGLAVTPRGAGTGLAGGAIGDGMVIDFSRYNRGITEFDAEKRTVRVGAGVVLDQLNSFLRPHGFWFGPDVATSSRATLGGMIANNSSGAHVPKYGTTDEHLLSVEIVLADGRIATVGNGHDSLAELHRQVENIVRPKADTVRARFHDKLQKRWPGYGMDRFLRAPSDLAKIICGSEGTLACIMSAELNLVPLPKRRGLCMLCFASVPEAMQATVDILDLEPAAVEHIDDLLFDQTRGQLAFLEARALLKLDEEPCKSILIVEFFDDIEEKLAALEKRNLGLRHVTLTDPKQQERIWNMRKSGLSLLTGCKGPSKPVPGIEDIAVMPHQLPDYINSLTALLARMGLSGSYYGHAASGLMHVRPVLDLHTAEGIAKYRQLSDEVAALVLQFKGSLCAEHGVGIAHTEHLPDQVGPELLQAMKDIKAAFDPKNRFNPGKIVADEHCYKLDENFRHGPSRNITLPFEPLLAFAAKDEGFIGNLEQCNGCGGCRKDPPTMCPTFVATGEEIMSTRGRANVIRTVLQGRLDGTANPLQSRYLEEALSNCLACKACTSECPSNVNMTLLKSELVHARHQLEGVSLRERMISRVDILGALGTITPRIANAVIANTWVRKQIERVLGMTAKRPLPPFALERFDRWFKRRLAPKKGTRGKVILWDDTFVRFYEPNVGKSVVEVLEAAGFEVALAEGRKCCGRPAFSVGCLDTAREFGLHNVSLLKDGTEPIIFVEPSCYSMFAQDYRELKIPDWDKVAKRCILFEQFLYNLLEKEPDALQFADGFTWVAVHGHCHAKALTDTSIVPRLISKLPNSTVTMLNTGCCGMAGAFGSLKSKYDLSVKVAQPLVEQINNLTAGTDVVAAGTSCRHQIDHLTPVKPLHSAEVFARALRKDE